MVDGVSKEALERIMSVLAAGNKPAADKYKESLAIIDKECQDLHVYSWVARGTHLVPVYPGTEIEEFNLLEEQAHGFLMSERKRLDDGEKGVIFGIKIPGENERDNTVVLIEKRRKGMLPAGPFNPYHNVGKVMDTIERVCQILRPEEQLENFAARANVLDLPDKAFLLGAIARDEHYPVLGIVSVNDADAVLDASGYVLTLQLVKEWVASVRELAMEQAELYYLSDTSFIVACTGSEEEGIAILRQLPDRLSMIKTMRYGRDEIMSLKAKASVVAVPMFEEYAEYPSRIIRSAIRYAGKGGGFFVFEDRHVDNRREQAAETLFDEFMGSVTESAAEG